MIKELDVVALTVDLPEYRLKKGAEGTVVLDHDSKGYEVEFLNKKGDTIAVVSLEPEQVRLVWSHKSGAGAPKAS